MAAAVVVTPIETVEWDDEDCRTPTAAESRIPEAATCPPAPMKQRMGGLPALSVRTKKFFNPPCPESVFAAHKAY